ncbi:hypothetical protein PSAC2689_50122 [Paraburkholderia sacchari]
MLASLDFRQILDDYNATRHMMRGVMLWHGDPKLRRPGNCTHLDWRAIEASACGNTADRTPQAPNAPCSA